MKHCTWRCGDDAFKEIELGLGEKEERARHFRRRASGNELHKGWLLNQRLIVSEWLVRLEKTQLENLAFHVGGAQQRDGKISAPSAKDLQRQRAPAGD